MGGNPVPFPLFVGEIELGPVMVRDPDQAGGNVRGPAEGDEDGRSLLAITNAVPEGDEDVRVRADAGRDILPDPLVKRLGLVPGVRDLSADFCRQVLHDFIPYLNARALSQIEPQLLGDRFLFGGELLFLVAVILLEESELVDGLGDDFLPFLNPFRGQKELTSFRASLRISAAHPSVLILTSSTFCSGNSSGTGVLAMIPLAFPFPCSSMPIESSNGRGSRYPFWSLGGSVQIHLPSPTTGMTLKAGGAERRRLLQWESGTPSRGKQAPQQQQRMRRERYGGAWWLGSAKERAPLKLTRNAGQSKLTRHDTTPTRRHSFASESSSSSSNLGSGGLTR